MPVMLVENLWPLMGKKPISRLQKNLFVSPKNYPDEVTNECVASAHIMDETNKTRDFSLGKRIIDYLLS